MLSQRAEMRNDALYADKKHMGNAKEKYAAAIVTANVDQRSNNAQFMKKTRAKT